MGEANTIQHHGAEVGKRTHRELCSFPLRQPWPMVLALGISLMLTGMVTQWVISLLGLLLTLQSAVGWFLEVLRHEHHVYVDIEAEELPIESLRTTDDRLPLDERHRKLLPIETFSIIAGIKGGLAGGTAMIVPAALFSLLKYHSIWYAMNLLAAGGFVVGRGSLTLSWPSSICGVCWQLQLFTDWHRCLSGCSMAPCCLCFLESLSLRLVLLRHLSDRRFFTPRWGH